MKTVIIGGVAGGASAAARLRRLDENAEIVILEKGDYVSFANCGLPYYIGNVITDRSKLAVQTPESLKNRFNIDVRVQSEAVSIDPNKKLVTVLNEGKTYTESYDNLILAMGAEPIRPPIDGINGDNVFTLRNIPDTFRIKYYIDYFKPKSVAVIGGGYIGVEMAENLKLAGLDVTIIEMADHIIAPLDFEIAADIHQHLTDYGIKIILNNGIQKIEGNKLTLQNGSLDADMVILSVGVKPETSIARACGIKTNDRGAIVTDSHMRTDIDGIYAVGDCAQVTNLVTNQPAFIPLAGPANKQGRIAADNICGIDSEYNGTQGSSVIKVFNMTAASTGLNEAAAQRAGIPYDKTYVYTPSHAGYYPGGGSMSIKILWNKETKKLIGAQIAGYDGVDKRMDVLATAIRFNASVMDLAHLELCYAPPFGSAKDPVNMIGFVAENVEKGKVKQFFWDDVDNLPRDGSVTLLDVRTPIEVSRGKIDGFIHIPVDVLRENAHKLPLDKPVYIHCHSGLRSYIACRMLGGMGYDCYNLAGGYRLYESAVKDRKTKDYICTECR